MLVFINFLDNKKRESSTERATRELTPEDGEILHI